MPPWQANRRNYIVRKSKWIFLFLRQARICNRRTKLILRIINNIIIRGLKLSNIRLCRQIIIKISVNIQVVRFNHQHYGNVRGFLQIPQLKTGQFINDNVIFLNFWQNVQSRHANISHQMNGFTCRAQNRRDKTTRRPLAFCASHANYSRWAIGKKLICRRPNLTASLYLFWRKTWRPND